MSEAPVKAPLTALGDFVGALGPPPERERITTYLARLRERVRKEPLPAYAGAAPSGCCAWPPEPFTSLCTC